DSDAALVSVPPDGDGDPLLASVSEMLASAQKLERIAYLSTVGVYGDHGGAWIDEATEPRPVSTRSKARLAAEGAWQEFGARAECSIAILRLAGIYGRGQNALVNLTDGSAKRIVKPGQVFNRIHVADIGQATEAA